MPLLTKALQESQRFLIITDFWVLKRFDGVAACWTILSHRNALDGPVSLQEETSSQRSGCVARILPRSIEAAALVVIRACRLFVVSIFESVVHAPEINLFTFKPTVSTWQIRQWLEAPVGAAIVIPSYIYLFIVVRRWVRTTFGGEGKDPVKDLLA